MLCSNMPSDERSIRTRTLCSNQVKMAHLWISAYTSEPLRTSLDAKAAAWQALPSDHFHGRMDCLIGNVRLVRYRKADARTAPTAFVSKENHSFRIYKMIVVTTRFEAMVLEGVMSLCCSAY